MGAAAVLPPCDETPATRGDRPRLPRQPSARAAGGCPPRAATTGSGAARGVPSREARGRWRRRRRGGAGPPAGSTGPGPALTQRVVLLEHPLHGAGRAGSGAGGGEARVRAGRDSWRAAGPVAVTVPVTTTTAAARQAGLPVGFLATARTAALPARRRRPEQSERRVPRRARGRAWPRGGVLGALEVASRGSRGSRCRGKRPRLRPAPVAGCNEPSRSARAQCSLAAAPFPPRRPGALIGAASRQSGASPLPR